MLFGIKFREKGSSEVLSYIVVASSEAEAFDKFTKEVLNDDGYDVDKRTITWGGSSIPLSHSEGIILYNNLDKIM
jgi:hypothetical protein